MRDIESKSGARMFVFDSMSEIVDYTDGKLFSNRASDFVGRNLTSWDSVEFHAKSHWQEGLSVLEAYVQELRQAKLPQLKSHKRRTQFDDQEGDEVDLDRLRQGQPYWRKSVREEAQGPHELTVVIDTTTPAYKESLDILWRGAAAIALTQILEERGYRVEVWVVNGSRLFRNKHQGVVTSACLKRCSDALDASTLINTVSGWFYRSATFTLLDTICKRTGNAVEMGYGPCYTPTQVDLDQVTPDELRIYSAGVYSYQGALAVILNELKKLKERETV